MTKPKTICFGDLKLEEKRVLSNGIVYEHWHDEIDNTHHFHFPDGMVITFEHEDAEGSVDIEEVRDGRRNNTGNTR